MRRCSFSDETGCKSSNEIVAGIVEMLHEAGSPLPVKSFKPHKPALAAILALQSPTVWGCQGALRLFRGPTDKCENYGCSCCRASAARLCLELLGLWRPVNVAARVGGCVLPNPHLRTMQSWLDRTTVVPGQAKNGQLATWPAHAWIDLSRRESASLFARLYTGRLHLLHRIYSQSGQRRQPGLGVSRCSDFNGCFQQSWR